MVRAADDLKEDLAQAGGEGVSVDLTGASGMWSDFNHANKTAMLKSEVISLAGHDGDPRAGVRLAGCGRCR